MAFPSPLLLGSSRRLGRRRAQACRSDPAVRTGLMGHVLTALAAVGASGIVILAFHAYQVYRLESLRKAACDCSKSACACKELSRGLEAARMP